MVLVLGLGLSLCWVWVWVGFILYPPAPKGGADGDSNDSNGSRAHNLLSKEVRFKVRIRYG